MAAQSRTENIIFWRNQAIFLVASVLLSCLALQLSNKALEDGIRTAHDSDIIGRVNEIKGRVLYRHAGDYVFRRLEKGHLLTRYMTIYTAENSWASLIYSASDSAVVSVPPNAIYRLEQELPITMLFRKGFTRSKSDFMQEDIKTDLLSKDSDVIVSGVQDTGEFFQIERNKDQMTNAVRFGLRMAFEMGKIPITFPLNNLYTWIDHSTGLATVPIQFAGVQREPLQVYLWRLRPNAKIVWSGLLTGQMRQVQLKINGAGTYVFQAFGAKGMTRTRSVRIIVEDKDPNQNLFPGGILGGDTILFN